MSMCDKRVGIVIPAYNVEQYLEECLDSVLKQTYDNIVIAVVNDGSTDDTWAIIQKYMELYPESVRGLNTENRGFMYARESCIELLEDCDYITFVDSDDALFSNDIVEKCVNEFAVDETDMVCFNFTHDTRPLYQTPSRLEYTQEQALRGILIQEYVDGNLCGGMYKYSYVKKLFRVQKCNNDDYINKAAFIRASNKIVVLPEVGYFYRINQQSQTHRMARESDYMYYEHVCIFCEELLKEYSHFQKECEYFKAWVLLWLATNCSKHKEAKKLRIYKPTMSGIKKYHKVYMQNPYFATKSRVTYLLIRMGLFTILYHVYHCFKG